MKILIVNTTDIQGGAARAAYRLHQSLLEQDVDSQMLVQYKSGDDDSVVTGLFGTNKIFNMAMFILDYLSVGFYRNRTKTLFSPAQVSFNNIVDRINEINPDIVHLHWICGGMIKIEDLARIKAPIVWSLHDMWAFTGGCHYTEECELYKSNCGNCKVLGSGKSDDLSRKIFNRKQEVFAKIDNLTIIGLSKWLNNCSKQSSLSKDKKHVNLPNPIDKSIFKKLDKYKSREFLKLPKDKKLILFGAMSAVSDKRKGFLELNEALSKLKGENIEFVVFGNKEKKQNHDLGFKTHYLGHINNDKNLVHLYSAADVMIVPSLQENLSNAILESLSCATPVVGFDIGGNSDMIDHKKNGYLVKPFCTDDLAYGIEWVLNNENYEELCKNAREKVVQNFDSKVVAKKYIELYESILSESLSLRGDTTK